MKILDRYLGRQVALFTLLALAIIVFLDSFFAFIDDLGDVGIQNYTLLHSVQYVLYTMPRRVYEMLPVSALIGSLLGLGGMASSNELTAIRAAGVSIRRIVWSGLKVGLGLMAITIALGEWVAPDMERQARELKALTKGAQLSAYTKTGFWARDGLTFIRVKEILPGAVLSRLTIYEFGDNRQLQSAIAAKTASYKDGAWHLQNVKQTRFIGIDEVKVTHITEAQWRSVLDPELLGVVVVKPENLSSSGLYTYIQYLEDNGLDSKRYQLAFWYKVFQPLSLLVMLFLAIPFVFGTLRSVSMGQRVFIGVMVGLGYSVMNNLVGHMGLVYGMNPLLSAVIPSLLMLSIALYAMRRVY